MAEPTKKLTLWEAASVVAGLGVGGGIMAIPYLASLNGLVTIFSLMLVSYLVSLLLHLMVVEVVLRDEEAKQLVEIFGRYLFIRSWWGSLLTWIFFALIVISFYSLLAGYIVGCGQTLQNLIGFPLWSGEILTYGAAAGVVFFGLKAIGISEKYAIGGIALVLIVLSLGSLGRPWNPLPALAGNAKTGLALYGMIMFSLSCFFSVPQAAEGLSWNKQLVPWAVVLGIAINLVFVIVMTVMVMLVSREVTEVATIGWGQAIGTWALVLASVFAILALLTSYWSVSYALAVILVERLHWGYRRAWLAATLPTFLLALGSRAGFLGFLRYAGGAMAVLTAILIVPAFQMARKRSPIRAPVFHLGFWGGPMFRFLLIIGYLLMAAGSILPLK